MHEYIVGNDDTDRPIEHVPGSMEDFLCLKDLPHVPGSMEDFLCLKDLPGFCALATWLTQLSNLLLVRANKKKARANALIINVRLVT